MYIGKSFIESNIGCSDVIYSITTPHPRYLKTTQIYLLLKINNMCMVSAMGRLDPAS